MDKFLIEWTKFMKMYFYFYFWIEHCPISIQDPHDPTTHILGNIFAYNKNNFIFWIIFKYPRIVKIPLEKKKKKKKNVWEWNSFSRYDFVSCQSMFTWSQLIIWLENSCPGHQNYGIFENIIIIILDNF